MRSYRGFIQEYHHVCRFTLEVSRYKRGGSVAFVLCLFKNCLVQEPYEALQTNVVPVEATIAKQLWAFIEEMAVFVNATPLS